MVERLGLSYKTANQLNEIIDKELPGRPAFRCQELVIGGERLEFHYREVIPCIRALYGDPEFANDLVFAPERHYTNREKTCRVYSEMHTGDWWWSVQVRKGSFESFTYSQVIPVVTRIAKSWCHHYPPHRFFRQNTSNTLSREDCLSYLSYHWKYTQGDPSKAVAPSTNVDRLPSYGKARRHAK